MATHQADGVIFPGHQRDIDPPRSSLPRSALHGGSGRRSADGGKDSVVEVGDTGRLSASTTPRNISPKLTSPAVLSMACCSLFEQPERADPPALPSAHFNAALWSFDGVSRP